jgi:hypothetical protein
MAAKMEKTKTPGIFKRGGRYVFSYRVNGRQRWDSCRTLEEARREKAARTTDIGRGEFDRRSRITLREYALEWIERYQGRGRRGFRDSTRASLSVIAAATLSVNGSPRPRSAASTRRSRSESAARSRPRGVA